MKIIKNDFAAIIRSASLAILGNVCDAEEIRTASGVLRRFNCGDTEIYDFTPKGAGGCTVCEIVTRYGAYRGVAE